MMQKNILIVSLLLTALLACDDATENNTLDSNAIQYTVSVDTSLSPDLTKGTPINSVTDATFNSIGILGYHTSNSFAATATPSSDFLANVALNKTGTNQWNFSKTYLWPQTGKISFFGYTPYASDANGIVVDPIQGATPYLSYTVPTSAANQPDLMVAIPQMDLFKTMVPLQFTHALACIGFDVSGEDTPIEYIGIKNVYTSGKLILSMANKAPQWQDLIGMSGDLYKIGLIPDAEARNPSTPVMATNGYLMMIPQDLSDDAAIVVKFQGIDPKEIPLKKAGTSAWMAGQKYIYTLKEGVYTLDVDVKGNNCQYTGGYISLNIKSIYTSQAGLTQDLGWKAEVVSSSTTNPRWTSIFNPDALNNQNPNKNFHINTAPYTTTSTIDNNLKKADSVLYQNMKDLSYVNGTYTTANCYVVNAPGWYKFPCHVMGNAINKGANNDVINNQSCIATKTPFFQDYTGSNITSTDQLAIDTNGATAQLVWSDAPDLVSNIGISNDQKYIEFYVSPETIRQGNAIIAIKKNDKVMWSWHVWVTDWALNTKTQSLGSDNQSIMPFGIGRCSAATYNYEQRSITIRFTQNTTNLTKDVTIVQQANTCAYGENVCFYQWGRKDPMIGSNGFGAQSKDCFGPSQFSLSTTTVPVNLNLSILNPQIFYLSVTYPSNWETPISYALWGANIVAEGSIKTIYDPSPAGYFVPNMHTIYAFADMDHKFSEDPINGCLFSPNKNGIYNIFLPVTGGRGPRDAAIMGNTPGLEVGYYWCNSNYITTDPVNKNTYLNLLFSVNKSPNVFTQVNPSASGLPVCAAVE